MANLKRKIFSYLITLGIVGGFFFLVHGSVDAVGFSIPNLSKYDTLEDVINAFLTLLRFIVIIVLIIALMFGGFTRITSQGDADKIAKSQKIIVSALIGFAIVILAPVIVEFAGRLFGAQGNLLDL